MSEVYELRRIIGAGSFGKVYEAWNVRAQEPCAIKVSKKGLIDTNREFEILGDLDHPHIVQLLDICEDQQNTYIVMELMNSGTLTDAMIMIAA